MSEPINRTINDLHPKMRRAVTKFEADLLYFGLLGTGGAAGFKLFEGYRSPERQNELFEQHPKVTKAKAWQSSHQYGLAVDYVWWNPEGGWDWGDNVPWDMLDAVVRGSKGVLRRPITWDRPHIEHAAWELIKLNIPR